MSDDDKKKRSTLSLPKAEDGEAPEKTRNRPLRPNAPRSHVQRPPVEVAPRKPSAPRKPAAASGEPGATRGPRSGRDDDRPRSAARSAAYTPRDEKRPSRPAPRGDQNWSNERAPIRNDGRANETPLRTARPKPEIDPTAPMRLSKRMAELGLCSRREADEYIERGWVKVDGVVVSELGSKILPDQHIELNRIANAVQHQRVTILLNKPIGYVSGQAEDGYRNAAELITAENRWEGCSAEREFEPVHARGLAPAGRLDIDSTGLLVLTQDGRIARTLIGDDSDVEKEYLVRVEGELSDDNMRLLMHGLVLDGVELRPAKVSWQNEDQLRFVLREGRKRQIRRMCELVGLHVVGLRRVRIGRIPLSKLPLGQWRYLGEHEKF